MESAVPRVGGGRPPGDDLGLGAGQGDIEVAELVSCLLGLVPGVVVLPVRPLAGHVEASIAGVVVVEGVPGREDVGLAREGQVDDGVLEALARVDGDDLHRGGVVVEATGALGGGSTLPPLLAEPAEEPGQAEAIPGRGLVQHLGQVAQVGQEPLAADASQDPLAEPACLRRREQRRDSLAAQQQRPAPEPVGDVVGDGVATGCRARRWCGRRSR